MTGIGTVVHRAAMLGALSLAACGSPGALRTGAVEPAEARASYERACASCHGVDGRGHGPKAPSLRMPPGDLTTLSAQNGGVFPREYVVSVIAGERPLPSHGTREMPVWSQRFGAETGADAAAALYATRRLESLADYIQSLQRTP